MPPKRDLGATRTGSRSVDHHGAVAHLDPAEGGGSDIAVVRDDGDRDAVFVCEHFSAYEWEQIEQLLGGGLLS
jgi:hypothetical protein